MTETTTVLVTRGTATACLEGMLALRRLVESYEAGEIEVPAVSNVAEQIGDALTSAAVLEALADEITAELGEEP